MTAPEIDALASLIRHNAAVCELFRLSTSCGGERSTAQHAHTTRVCRNSINDFGGLMSWAFLQPTWCLIGQTDGGNFLLILMCQNYEF